MSCRGVVSASDATWLTIRPGYIAWINAMPVLCFFENIYELSGYKSYLTRKKLIYDNKCTIWTNLFSGFSVSFTIRRSKSSKDNCFALFTRWHPLWALFTWWRLALFTRWHRKEPEPSASTPHPRILQNMAQSKHADRSSRGELLFRTSLALIGAH